MRNPEKPMGKISSLGAGVARVASAIHYCLHFEGPQSVFVCEHGRVYVLPQGTQRSEEWMAKRRDWWIGNYTSNAYRTSRAADEVRAEVIADLLDRAHELRAMATVVAA